MTRRTGISLPPMGLHVSLVTGASKTPDTEMSRERRERLSVSAISEMTGYDRKTVRKCLLEPEAIPAYSRRAGQPSKLDPHKPYAGSADGWRLERAGVTAGDPPARLWRRLHDSEGLATATTRGSQRRGRSPL